MRTKLRSVNAADGPVTVPLACGTSGFPGGCRSGFKGQRPGRGAPGAKQDFFAR